MARLVRLIVYAFLAVLAISFIRGVIGIFSRAVAEAVKGNAAGSKPSQRAGTGSFGGDLVKDPVCGTFIAITSPYSKSAGGETYHFCSQECLDRFPASTS
jgi:YHS domain-containing protein